MAEIGKAGPDIGLCDDCGSEDGTRRPVIVEGLGLWLCPRCRGALYTARDQGRAL